MTNPFYVKVGMSPAEYNQRNHLYITKEVDKQPAGLNFYEQNWNSKALGLVRIEHGDYSFTIPHVLGTLGTEDTEHVERGIYTFSVRSGISVDNFISHDQARVEFMQFLQKMVSLGWLSYIEYPSDPRLLGSESFQYALDDGSYAPDPLYVPTLNEWMSLGSSHAWVFHVDNTFLEINFRRNRRYMEKNGSGVYLITSTFYTRDARVRNYFQGDEKEQWEKLWVGIVKKYKLMRYQEEVELIKQGYHINTDYIEPKFHPDDPVEPDDEESIALREFIQQHNNQK